MQLLKDSVKRDRRWRTSKARLLSCAAAIVLAGATTHAQQDRRPSEVQLLRSASMPGILGFSLHRLGTRLQRTEQASVMYTAGLTDTRQRRTVRWLFQAGQFRFEDGSDRVITSDRRNVRRLVGALNADDEAIAEILLYETPEAFFTLAASQELSQRGLRVQIGPVLLANYQGPFYDVYSSNATDVSGLRKLARLYFVNWETQRLERVRSIDAAGNMVSETFLNDWTTVGSNSYPTIITRQERGREVVRVNVDVLQTSAAVDSVNFQ